MIKNWFRGIKGKLLALTLVPILGLAIVLGTAAWVARELSDDLKASALVEVPLIDYAGRMEVAVNAIARTLWETYTTDTSNSAARNQLLSEMRNHLESFEKSKSQFISLPHSEGAAQAFKGAESTWPKLKEVSAEIAALLEKHSFLPNEQAKVLIANKLMPLTTPVLEALGLVAKAIRADVDVQTKANLAASSRNQFLMILMGAITAVFSLVWAMRMSRTVSSTLVHEIQKLASETNQTKSSAANISSASQELAQAANEQAASLQETSASVEEMSAMISKSADNATRSGTAAKSSLEVANRGKAAADEMIQAIREINRSNDSIMKQIEESNARITDIANVIREIGNKTKVINDIVFQTKLLSFNASVEAARAGEHGKGFAVVAEEVGNLAQMSGNAANEIAQMLDNSIRTVETIVQETKAKVERLVADGKVKVQTGTKVAEESGKVLEEIVREVERVSGMVSEIASASREQAAGVSEITKAMGQLDQVTHQNTNVSGQIAAAAEQLSTQAQSLGTVVHALSELVYGDSSASFESGDNIVTLRGDSETSAARSRAA